jgi:hypothetical protein
MKPTKTYSANSIVKSKPRPINYTIEELKSLRDDTPQIFLNLIIANGWQNITIPENAEHIEKLTIIRRFYRIRTAPPKIDKDGQVQLF